MQGLPRELEDAFYSGNRSENCPLCVNDLAQVVSGESAGVIGSVVCPVEAEPVLTFLLETEEGADFVVESSNLQLCRKATE